MKSVAGLALASLLLAPPASAQAVDQMQNHAITYFWGPYPFAQSFQPDSAYSIGAGVAVFTYETGKLTDGSSHQLTINLWDMLPNDPNATQLAGGTVTAIADTKFDKVFWDPIAVTPGQTYFLEFVLYERAYLGVNDPALNYGPDYENGAVWQGNPLDLSEPYQRRDQFDFAFVTYAPGVDSTVPEPATMTLLATGLAALGASRRRKSSL